MDKKYLKAPLKTTRKVKVLVGDDYDRQAKYYAFLYHRAQAKYRKEPYDLTWEQWDTVWSNDLWIQRGRGADDLCISRTDPNDSWNTDNIRIIPRRVHLKVRWETIKR